MTGNASAARQPRTLGDLLSRAAAQYGERIAWVFPDADRPMWTFTQIDRAVDRIAALLRRHGSPGDRVAVMLPNVPEFPLVWLAAARSRRVIVPINTRTGSTDAAHLLSDAEPSLVVTVPEHLAVIGAAADEAGIEVTTVLTDRLPLDGADDAHDTAAGPAPSAEDNGEPGDLVNVQYTSGTSGLPKGCMLNHRYWLTIGHALRENFPGLGEQDVLYTAQPFSYMDPQWNVVAALLSGARLVVADRFRASRMWDDVRQHGVTVFYCLGMMPAALLAQPPHPRDREHKVRAILASGIPTDLHRALEDRWGAPWYEAFGMTESGADLIVTPQDHDEVVGTGCIGRPQPGKRVAVVDGEDRPVPVGEVGELVISGTGLMDGYWRRPEASAEIFRSGWLHTGDRVRMDGAGRVHYLGRAKDMVRRSGENISAREVEALLESHPSVRVAAVVPEPDPIRGEEVKVFLVPDGDTVPDLPELREFCRRRLAPFKVPRYWCVRTELPATPSERVAKAQLRADREPCWDAAGVGASAANDPGGRR
ncbi:AMP-binding protein [Streptomyces sp. NPDC086080]|uniref:AMP-binding protein n=1 Tax=Streptomyces sp. NPDC086080 TaxID=3365748 RepID=UPI0037D1F8F7